MDLIVTTEPWICFGGIASILKKQILIQVTHLSIHMDLFLFLYHSFLKKKKYSLQRPVLNWFTESNKKLNR